MPTRGRNIRVDDDLWNAAQEAAAYFETDLSAEARRAYERLVKRHEKAVATTKGTKK